MIAIIVKIEAIIQSKLSLLKYFSHFIMAKALQIMPEIRLGFMFLYFVEILPKSNFNIVMTPAIKAAKRKMCAMLKPTIGFK